jgi:hypothetical protein
VPRIDAWLEAYARPEDARGRVRSTAGLEYTLRSQDVSLGETEDLHRLWLDRDPLADLALMYEGTAADLGVVARLERAYRKDPWLPSNLPGSEPGDPLTLENKFVREGWLSLDLGAVRADLGRMPVHLGPLEGGLLASSRLPYLDALRLRVPMGRLAMDSIIASIESRGSFDDVLPYSPDVDGPLILYSLHRFEYAFRAFRLGFAGQQVVARENNAFVLADIFPVFSWHQSDLVPNNLSIVLDAEAVPLPGLRLMAELGFDDINLTSLGQADSGVPTITALVAGAEYLLRLGSADVRFRAEGGATHYLWGNFETPAVDPEISKAGRAIYRLWAEDGSLRLPLTSPYGPGVRWTLVGVEFRVPPSLEAGVTFRWLSRNTLADLVTTPYEASSAVANAPRTDTLSLLASAQWRPWRWLEVSIEPSGHFQLEPWRGWSELGMAVRLIGDASWRMP